MIALDHVFARSSSTWFKAPARIDDVSLTWESGVLAILGAPADGTTVLLETLAGVLPVRRGHAVVDGAAPQASRARIAWVPATTTLPDALRVEELCTLEAELRGQDVAAPRARLAVLGLESLAKRRVRSLAPGEARSVALALALTSKAKVLLVDEPLAGLEAMAPGRVIDALRACGAAGAAVIVTTSSVRDATRLADQLGILVRGVFKHLPASLAHAGPGGAHLRVVIAAEGEKEISPFVDALSAHEAITKVEAESFRGTRVLHAAAAVIVSGKDVLSLARAIARAAASARANVLTIESAVLPLEAIRLSIVGPPPSVLEKGKKAKTEPAPVTDPSPSAIVPVPDRVSSLVPTPVPSAPAELLSSKDLELDDLAPDPSESEPSVIITSSEPSLAIIEVVEAVESPKPTVPPPLPARARLVGTANTRPPSSPSLPPPLPPRAGLQPPRPFSVKPPQIPSLPPPVRPPSKPDTPDGES